MEELLLLTQSLGRQFFHQNLNLNQTSILFISVLKSNYFNNHLNNRMSGIAIFELINNQVSESLNGLVYEKATVRDTAL